MIQLDNAKELQLERYNAFRGAIRDDAPKTRVPLYNMDMTWKVFDQGY